MSTFLLSLLLVNAANLVLGHDIKSFQVLKLAANDSFLCATDTPTASLSIDDAIVGIPLGIPDAVRCGFLCSGFSNCSSYNYAIKQTTTYCDLYTFIPRNCLATTTQNCQHFQLPRKQGSCTPVCDPNCTSECVIQGAGKCDSECISGMGLTSQNTCSSCDVNCVGQCTMKGAGKCDNLCKSGWIFTSRNTCERCPSGYTYQSSTGSCYRLYEDIQMWNVSADRCASDKDGAHLVFIESSAEQSLIKTLTNSSTAFRWTGGQRIDPSSLTNFVWMTFWNNGSVTYKPVVYTYWYPGEPNLIFENCLMMYSNMYDFLWNDIASPPWQFASICEFEL